MNLIKNKFLVICLFFIMLFLLCSCESEVKLDDFPSEYSIEYIYDNVGTTFFNEQITFASKGKMIGLLNKKGEFIEIGEYDFKEIKYPNKKSEGPFCIQLIGENKKDNKYLTQNGKTYDEIIFGDATDDINQKFFITRNGKQFGLVQGEGKLVLNCQYDEVKYNSAVDCVFYKKNNLWGVFDNFFGVKTACIFDDVTGEEETMSVRKNGYWFTVYDIAISKREGERSTAVKLRDKDKWGIVANSGDVILNYEYDNIESFSGNTYIIKDKKWGMASSSGEVLVEPIYSEIYPTHENKYLFVRNKSKWGVVDYTGKTVIECEYSRIEEPVDSCFSMIKEGKTEIYDVNNDNTTYIDVSLDATTIIEGFREEGSEEKNYVLKVMQGDKVGLLNFDGSGLLDIFFSDVKIFGDCILAKRDNKWNIYSKKGVLAHEYDFDDVYRELDDPEDENYFPNVGDCIYVKKGNKIGLMNSKCQMVIECIYDNIYDYNREIVYVELDGKKQYVDYMGNIFGDSIEYERLTAKNGFIVVYNKGKYGLYDNSGNRLLDTIYDEFTKYSDTYDIVTQGEKKGVFSYDLKMMIKAPKYDNIRYFKDDIAICEKDGKVGLIDLNTWEEILPCKFEEIYTAISDGEENNNLCIVVIDGGYRVYNYVTKLEFLFIDFSFAEYLGNGDLLLVKDGKFGILKLKEKDYM